jgi:hypothetical protein
MTLVFLRPNRSNARERQRHPVRLSFSSHLLPSDSHTKGMLTSPGLHQVRWIIEWDRNLPSRSRRLYPRAQVLGRLLKLNLHHGLYPLRALHVYHRKLRTFFLHFLPLERRGSR